MTRFRIDHPSGGIGMFACCVMLLAAVAGISAAPADDDAIRAKVAQLDDEQFAVRQRAAAEILTLGEAAIPHLLRAAKGDSAEQRARATELLRTMQVQKVSRGFRELGQLPDDAIDVEHGMWLIALLLDPDVSEKAIGAKLDEMAAAVRKAVGEGVDPKSLPGSEIMSAVIGVLKDEYGLEGDQANYHHPDNSSIHRVIEQKNGLPILLSEIAVAVGRRLEVPIVGIPVPGRYMIKYDGAQAPAGAAREDIIIDPFGGWVVTDPAQIDRAINFFVPQLHLVPSDPRQTLERMLNNLESDFLVQGKTREAEFVRTCLSQIAPALPLLPAPIE